MNHLTLAAALLTAAAACPCLAQDGLPLPQPPAAPAAPKAAKPVPSGLTPATILGAGEDDPVEGRLQIRFGGGQPRFVVGSKLLGVLREHARNRDVRVEAAAQGANEVRVTAIEAIATRDLSIFAKGDLHKSAPIGTLPKGTRTLVTGGRIHGMQTSGKFPKGTVMLAGLRFGEPMVRADDDQALTGVLTADGEDDPAESAPVFRHGGQERAVRGPLTGLLREHARNRTIQIQGSLDAEGVRVRAIRATATTRLPIFAMGDDVGHDQPIGYLAQGDRVWVVGGNVYVEQLSEGQPRGKVQAARLSFGARLPAGMIDALDDD